jgi:hypothetical protein
MEMTNNSNTCENCPFRGHSGAFTPGGARNVCKHDDAYEDRFEIPEEYRKGFYEVSAPRNKYHWFNNHIGTGTPSPDWCPLKRK